MLLDWDFFRCLINLANHFWSIQVQFLSFNPSMKSKASTSTNSYLPQTHQYHLWTVLDALFEWGHCSLHTHPSHIEWKKSFIWLGEDSFNIPHCHQSNVILFQLLWCYWVFFLYHITHFICFEITWEIIVRIDSIPSSSRFIINGWHCRQCGQGILNRSGHTIRDDEFLFVKDGLIRLWEHRIRGNHLAIHMISGSWITLKEYAQKFVWNISRIAMYGLVHYHQNTKQIFPYFPVTKDTKTLKQHQQFFLELTSSVTMSMLKLCSLHVLVWFSNEVYVSNLIFLPLNSLCKVIASNKSSNNTVIRKRVLDIVFLNDVSLEFFISTLTASQNIACPYLVGSWQMFKSSIQFQPSKKEFDDDT